MKCLCVDDEYFEILMRIIVNVSTIETIGKLRHFGDCKPSHSGPGHLSHEKWA